MLFCKYPKKRVRNIFERVRSSFEDVRSFVEGVRSFVEGVRSFIEGVRSFIEGVRSFIEGVRSFVEGVRSSIVGILFPSDAQFYWAEHKNSLNKQKSRFAGLCLLFSIFEKEQKETNFLQSM